MIVPPLPPARLLARVDALLRPQLVRLPPAMALRIYSATRSTFVELLAAQPPRRAVVPPASLAAERWGITFRSPIGNAAGLWKSGKGYVTMARQGAGWYLAGTTTASPRKGNRRAGVRHPFAPYPRSGAASNWLGLPNPGHDAVAARLARLERVPGMPIGASLTADPPAGGPGAAGASDEDRRLTDLIAGLRAYERAGVDLIEINESCPNTEGEAARAGLDAMAGRLDRLADDFLARRTKHRNGRPLPVLVKLSNDTPLECLPETLDLLLDRGFDGVVFGNTSVAYSAVRAGIDPLEQALFDRFVETFGGGVSGRPLRSLSLELCRAARRHLVDRDPAREFHVVRTGGIETADDLSESLASGASLAQWYTGYFDAFARDGHRLYERLYAARGVPRAVAG